MEIKEYQEKTAETAIYPGAGEVLKEENLMGLLYVVLGLNGEAGELGEVVKKLLRDNNGIIDKNFILKIRGEIGDCFYYLLRICSELEIDAREILQENIDKLLSRKNRGVLSGSGSNR